MKAKTYKYTKKSIAQSVGISESKVRKDARKGVFDPSSLLSTSAYIVQAYLGKMGLRKDGSWVYDESA